MNTHADDASEDVRSLESDNRWSLKPLLRHAERSHKRMPGIRKIPFRAIAIIAFIAFINIIVWVAAAIVLVSQVSIVYRNTIFVHNIDMSIALSSVCSAVPKSLCLHASSIF